jgi:ATP-dependent helicase/nuclease subunit A
LDFPIVFVPEIGTAPPRSDKGAARISLGAGDAPNVIAVRAADETGLVIEPPSFSAAYATTRRRDRAERQRLAYVAITRAADAMFLVGGRAREATSDVASSTLGVLEEIARDERTLAAAELAVEDVEVPAPVIRRYDAPLTVSVGAVPMRAPLRPSWRALPIAPTALADFDHCSRRFELVHVLGLPEHVRGARAADVERAGAALLDARSQGTLAHAVLERIPTSAFAGVDAGIAASRALAAEGVPVEHAQHSAIVTRVERFLRGSYAQALADGGAELRREVDFVFGVDDAEGRSVVLRGSMDLVVVWPDGAVDVVDYKSARGGAEGAYAFQLDVYALAARAMYPEARRLRAGLVYLGGASSGGEPSWRTLPDETDVRTRLAALGERLVRARWDGAFPRVALERCEAIHCGFIGRCHASAAPAASDPSSEAKGTDENPSRATTT